MKNMFSWATPCEKTKATVSIQKIGAANEEFLLKRYSRTLHLVDVPTVRVSLFADLLSTHLPRGVQMTIRPHQDADDDIRYVPDYEEMELKKRLELAEKNFKSLKIVAK